MTMVAGLYSLKHQIARKREMEQTRIEQLELQLETQRVVRKLAKETEKRQRAALEKRFQLRMDEERQRLALLHLPRSRPWSAPATIKRQTATPNIAQVRDHMKTNLEYKPPQYHHKKCRGTTNQFDSHPRRTLSPIQHITTSHHKIGTQFISTAPARGPDRIDQNYITRDPSSINLANHSTSYKIRPHSCAKYTLVDRQESSFGLIKEYLDDSSDSDGCDAFVIRGNEKKPSRLKSNQHNIPKSNIKLHIPFVTIHNNRQVRVLRGSDAEIVDKDESLQRSAAIPYSIAHNTAERNIEVIRDPNHINKGMISKIVPMINIVDFSPINEESIISIQPSGPSFYDTYQKEPIHTCSTKSESKISDSLESETTIETHSKINLQDLPETTVATPPKVPEKSIIHISSMSSIESLSGHLADTNTYATNSGDHTENNPITTMWFSPVPPKSERPLSKSARLRSARNGIGVHVESCGTPHKSGFQSIEIHKPPHSVYKEAPEKTKIPIMRSSSAPTSSINKFKTQPTAKKSGLMTRPKHPSNLQFTVESSYHTPVPNPLSRETTVIAHHVQSGQSLDHQNSSLANMNRETTIHFDDDIIRQGCIVGEDSNIVSSKVPNYTQTRKGSPSGSDLSISVKKGKDRDVVHVKPSIREKDPLLVSQPISDHPIPVCRSKERDCNDVLVRSLSSSQTSFQKSNKEMVITGSLTNVDTCTINNTTEIRQSTHHDTNHIIRNHPQDSKEVLGELTITSTVLECDSLLTPKNPHAEIHHTGSEVILASHCLKTSRESIPMCKNEESQTSSSNSNDIQNHHQLKRDSFQCIASSQPLLSYNSSTDTINDSKLDSSIAPSARVEPITKELLSTGDKEGSLDYQPSNFHVPYLPRSAPPGHIPQSRRAFFIDRRVQINGSKDPTSVKTHLTTTKGKQLQESTPKEPDDASAQRGSHSEGSRISSCCGSANGSANLPLSRIPVQKGTLAAREICSRQKSSHKTNHGRITIVKEMAGLLLEDASPSVTSQHVELNEFLVVEKLAQLPSLSIEQIDAESQRSQTSSEITTETSKVVTEELTSTMHDLKITPHVDFIQKMDIADCSENRAYIAWNNGIETMVPSTEMLSESQLMDSIEKLNILLNSRQSLQTRAVIN
ncbi:hypothetical protein BASA62_000043 [Batrachochytrium salamandrivorans]|nr:hypothetical protein BASA62_000043 [Batrachochytrium salamandrivorans]